MDRGQPVTIGAATVQRMIYNDIPVCTFEMIAEVHGISVKTVRSAFNYNRRRFKEGVHKFRLDFATASQILEFQVANPNGVIVLTKKGYLLIVKPLQDDMAWKVQAQMVDEYFDLLEERAPHLPILTPYRLSRERTHLLTMDDGNQIEVRIKLPQIIWDICDEVYRKRQAGPTIHFLTYPWAGDDAKAEYRRRKLTGEGEGRKGDTFGQHMVLEIFYSGTLEMVGVMKSALATIRKREQFAPLKDETRIAMFKELTVETVRSVGICIPLVNNTVLALYPEGKQELLARPQLSQFDLFV